jgi:isoleucyl-tRNA synthetase
MGMKFQKGTRRRALVYEKELTKYWQKHNTFQKSVQMRPAENAYVFYDGPPFITGIPHAGTLLSSVAKDVVPRFWTMKGKRVERVWGWDCHGLPAEVFTEKKLGIKDKRDIGTKISLEEYIVTCRENMVQTGNLWEDTIDRIGRWVDFKGAYKTMDKEFMESVWWAFKKLYEDGKIYEGEKVLLYCTRDATPISKAEVAMDNSYQDVTDPSVFVKFKLKGEDTYVLAWTTTPWTLPANTAVAVNKDSDYAEVELGDGTKLILAKDLVGKVLTDEKHQPVPHTIIRTFKGDELVGREYEPLFQDRGDGAHKIWHADYVSLDDGTGIVHLAPAYGEEDYALSKQVGFPFVNIIDDNGLYTEGEWQGQNVWEANKPIAKELHARGVVWKIDYIKHSYPHCHRCGTKLMYRAHPSWFMDIANQREQMLEQNGNVNWFPEHLKKGRFAKTVESAPDWNLSRDRFWATAMPVWKGTDADGNEKIKVVGSYAELKELSGVELEDYHRPWIDDVTFTIDGVEYKRIDKVLDCWFESGSMPFAQFHYPFENVQKFEQSFPGDFIVEYVGQVRAWFYYVHAVSVGLFGNNGFKNVITTGTLAGNDGRKMSKSFGNYTDPNELMDQYSADSLRFLLMSSPVMNGEDYSLQDKDVADVARKLSMVWNMYDFFTLYAEVDAWEWDGEYKDPSAELKNPLDQWIVARVHQLTQAVERDMERYDVPNATKHILPFIEDASNWYVRRSRRRFWKSGDDADKNAAYKTLHYVLVQLAHVMAPFTPFLAEELYQKLTGGESVHLRDWPATGHINELVLDRMAYVRQVINDGLSQRAAAGVKVRQPLAKVTVNGATSILGENEAELLPIILEELNVKACETTDEGEGVALDLELTDDLKAEGAMRELVRHIQNLRKTSGLNVEDRIVLHVQSDDELVNRAMQQFGDAVLQETLATELVKEPQEHTADVKVDGAQATVSLKKA